MLRFVTSGASITTAEYGVSPAES